MSKADDRKKGDSGPGEKAREAGDAGGSDEPQREVTKPGTAPETSTRVESDGADGAAEVELAPGGVSPGGGEAHGLSERNAELLDSLVRLKAEFENYRKRMLKEQTRILETAESGLIKKLLPVIDNLERALESASPGVDDAGGLRKGVEMVLGQLLELLVKEGLEVISPEGEPFDPEHHEAMMVVETDECPEDTVIGVTQKGYRFNGVLLRPAMVRVSCAAKGS